MTAEVPILTIVKVEEKKALTSAEFRKKYYKGVTAKQWNDWRWQMANILNKKESIERIINLSASEDCAFNSHKGLPFAVTPPYYASLIAESDSENPIRRTVIPTHYEMIADITEADDPLGEDHSSPVEGLVHRYPDRVLFLVTEHCSTYCRYCTRSRKMGEVHQGGNIKQRCRKP